MSFRNSVLAVPLILALVFPGRLGALLPSGEPNSGHDPGTVTAPRVGERLSQTGTLSGTVTAAGAGTPLPGAIVALYLEGDSAVLDSQVTGESGQYGFDIPADSYRVSVAAAGYDPASASAVCVMGDQTTTQDFALVAVQAVTDLSITRSGADALLSWTALSGNVASYELWRGTTPYFVPLPGIGQIIADGSAPACELTEGTITCTDVAAIGDPIVNHYYLVRAVGTGGGWSASSKRVGEFDCGLAGTGWPIATATPTPTPTETATPMPTPTETPAPTPTESATPTPTPTETVTPVPTPTESATPTPTPTESATSTATSTVTVTPTATPFDFMPIGSLTVTGGPYTCDGDKGCYDIRVQCTQLTQAINATLRVGEPTGQPERGTVVFFSGWTGTLFLGEWGTEVERILTELRAAGYRTVDVQWASTWFMAATNEPAGLARLACRAATVTKWSSDRWRRPALGRPICIYGHSNGASEVAYLLTRYGLADVLSGAMMDGGPNFARLDAGCLHDDPQLSVLWYLGGRATIDWAFGFPSCGTGPCDLQNASWRPQFEESSLSLGSWQYVYPQTMVHFIFGELDAGTTRAHGEYFYQILAGFQTPLLRREVVPGVGHEVTPALKFGSATGVTGISVWSNAIDIFSTPEGANAIRDGLIADCQLH